MYIWLYGSGWWSLHFYNGLFFLPHCEDSTGWGPKREVHVPQLLPRRMSRFASGSRVRLSGVKAGRNPLWYRCFLFGKTSTGGENDLKVESHQSKWWIVHVWVPEGYPFFPDSQIHKAEFCRSPDCFRESLSSQANALSRVFLPVQWTAQKCGNRSSK